jgi:coproporphyrinogen III oxidase
MANLYEIKSYLINLQDNICDALEILDTKSKFISDKWIREDGGGGDTRVIADGLIFEKGGVNFSHVHGTLPSFLKSETKEANFFHATGVSIVIHTQNPYVPIIHMNVRYFCMLDKEDGNIVDEWFGGGIDVSPAYPNETDVRFLHQYLKDECDKFDITFYPEFKAWCDDYFTIQHRKQMRGIGGIFYDHLRPIDAQHKSFLFEFMKTIGDSFIPIYSTLVNNNKLKPFTDKNKEWQYIRRALYTEFNLVYDRGTHFGLKTNGRIESILMSLPPRAEWKYDYKVTPNSEEENTLKYFQPQNWL